MSLHLLIARLRQRLTGSSLTSKSYRAPLHILSLAHPYILKLIKDSHEGDTRRASLVEWLRAERPVLDVLHGTHSMLRIDGPRQVVGHETFPFGSLIESPGVTAHLDPIETLHLERRIRETIEREISCWIEQHGLRERPPADLSFNREMDDLIAIARMDSWTNDRWDKGQSNVQ